MRLLLRPATAVALLAAVAITLPAARAASIDPPDPGQPPYVVVTALDGNPDTTTSLVVQLQLNWPAGAEQALVTNGDGLATTLTLNAPVVDWQLLPLAAGSAADTRTVTVTYRGPAIADARWRTASCSTASRRACRCNASTPTERAGSWR